MDYKGDNCDYDLKLVSDILESILVEMIDMNKKIKFILHSK